MGKKLEHISKVGKLSEIGNFIKPGDFVAIGGGWSCNKPMAIIREIIRQEISNLKVVSVVGGWEMEWLLAAGSVDHLVFSFLSLEFFGHHILFAGQCIRGYPGSTILRTAPEKWDFIQDSPFYRGGVAH